MDDAIRRLRENVCSVFLGNPEAVDQVLCTLLARGHALIEDVPGVGKTVLAMALARSVAGSFSRVQLTPDLLPADILGVNVLDQRSASFEFKQGPIFANIVLADEINRTPPRTQAALLEAMSESCVTIDGVRHPLPSPFMLVATQNPFDMEGTYLLPENQLDRFFMRIQLGYPSNEQEARVLEMRPADGVLPDLSPVVSLEELSSLQARVDDVRTDRALIDYTVQFAARTRENGKLRLGLSTRGALALIQAARAAAVLKGRDYVVPEDITDNIGPVCSHRVIGADWRNGGDVADTADLLMSIVETLEAPI